MADLLLHSQTKQDLHLLLSRPAHGVLVTGTAGVGKASVLNYLAAHLLGGTDNQNQPRILRILPIERGVTKGIGIEQIRELQRFVSLKTTGQASIRRIVLIEDANTMSGEAQNALLKIIEEPPADTVLLLSVPSARQLLPTICSRVRELAVLTPGQAAAVKYFKDQGYDSDKVASAVLMAGGLPGLIKALLDEAGEHPLHVAADWSRRLLSASKFERLILVDELSKQRDIATATCELLARMASMSIKKPGVTDAQQATWLRVLKHATAAGENLRAYANPKLTLDMLVLAM